MNLFLVRCQVGKSRHRILLARVIPIGIRRRVIDTDDKKRQGQSAARTGDNLTVMWFIPGQNLPIETGGSCSQPVT